jgi:predicted dehydrogenase
MIGCGSVTEVKSGPGFQKAEGSSLVAVMRRNGELAADYARRHGVPKHYDDAQALIDDPEVDAIYLATPPNSHYDYALRAAAAGKPVYCEKPMGLNAEQSRKMVEACKEAGVPLFCAYYRRALPKYLQVKELIDSGHLGPVRSVHILMQQTIKEEDYKDGGIWRVNPEISGGGKFHDVGSHALDLIDWLLGPIAEANGEGLNQSRTYRADDVVYGRFRTESGVAGTGQWCFNTFKDDDRTEILFEKGKLTYSVLDIAAPLFLETEAGVQSIAVSAPPMHVAQPLIQTVVNHLLGKGVCESTGESALRTDIILEKLAGKA